MAVLGAEFSVHYLALSQRVDKVGRIAKGASGLKPGKLKQDLRHVVGAGLRLTSTIRRVFIAPNRLTFPAAEVHGVPTVD